MPPQSKQATSMMGSFFGDGILSRSNSDISLTGMGVGDTVRRSNSEVSLAGTDQCEASVHHCLELGCFPDEAAELPEEQRIKFVRHLTKSSKPGGFEADSLVARSPMRWYEEVTVALVMLLWLGGPLFCFYTSVILLIWGTWTQVGYFCAAYLILGFHPLPDLEETLHKSRFSMWLYKYFSYRLIWSDDAMDKIQNSPPWVGASGPHSVMPFGSVLNIPSVNHFVFRKFKGCTASVLGQIPMLRYLWLWGCEDVSGKNMKKMVEKGYCVGLVCDGIAGIFKGDVNNEAFFLKDRKSLARWALRHGVPIVPAYSIGNSQAFYSWFDSFGFLEWVSRKTQVALFLYFGRCGLPIPFRVNVTQLLGAPIIVKKVENPTDEQVDKLHQLLLDTYVQLFDTHKHALGWGHKVLKIV